MNFKIDRSNGYIKWYSGIYKIRYYRDCAESYRLKCKRVFYAFFKPKGWKNWGNRVEPHVEGYRSFDEAVRACERHEERARNENADNG